MALGKVTRRWTTGTATRGECYGVVGWHVFPLIYQLKIVWVSGEIVPPWSLKQSTRIMRRKERDWESRLHVSECMCECTVLHCTVGTRRRAGEREREREWWRESGAKCKRSKSKLFTGSNRKWETGGKLGGMTMNESRDRQTWPAHKASIFTF